MPDPEALLYSRNRAHTIMTDSSTSYIYTDRYGSDNHATEASPMLGQTVNDDSGKQKETNEFRLKNPAEYINAPSQSADIRLHFDPFYFSIALCVYLFVFAFVSSGQQHMDWGVNIGVWAVLTTIGQFASTLSCAYYWKKLKSGGRHPQKNEILILSTVTALLFFKMSIDVYFIQSYASLYDTQSGLMTFAQRQFDSFFNLISVAFVTIVPYSLYFSIQHYKPFGTTKAD